MASLNNPKPNRDILNEDTVVTSEETGSSPPFHSPIFSSPQSERALVEPGSDSVRFQMARNQNAPKVPALEPEAAERADKLLRPEMQITYSKYKKAGSATKGSPRGPQSAFPMTPAESTPTIAVAGIRPLNTTMPAEAFTAFSGTAAARSSCSTLLASRASRIRLEHGNSRSLHADEASSTSDFRKSTIQQEYHDMKVRRKIRSLRFGGGPATLLYALAFFALALVLFLSGLTLCLLNFHALILLHPRRDDILGPILIALSLLAGAVGFRFVCGAYLLSSYYRSRLRVYEIHLHLINII